MCQSEILKASVDIRPGEWPLTETDRRLNRTIGARHRCFGEGGETVIPLLQSSKGISGERNCFQ